jgi:lysophospholipase L1-like esterase
MIKELSEVHDNCFALDHMSDPRFDSRDFHDGIHLNKNGAKKMSEILDKELEDLENL